MTDDYIVWATTWGPTPAEVRAPLQIAIAAYDEVDARLGDLAEGDDFLTRSLWLEVSLRLARLGWSIAEVEARRWPLQGASRIGEALRDI
jgi:hypothetical protein